MEELLSTNLSQPEKGALLNVVWVGEEFLKDLRTGVNQGC
jgi:hypothetical protein